MTQITIALTKGRILQETLPLLARAGIAPLEDLSTSRKLVFDTTRANVRLIILRGSDVPTYVQFGAADIGVSGKDMLLEHQGDGYYEPLDLGIARDIGVFSGNAKATWLLSGAHGHGSH